VNAAAERLNAPAFCCAHPVSKSIDAAAKLRLGGHDHFGGG
jgi:hypothetical protein